MLVPVLSYKFQGFLGGSTAHLLLRGASLPSGGCSLPRTRLVTAVPGLQAASWLPDPEWLW